MPDDNTILNVHDLWRRIPHWHFVPNANTGRVAISSAAFANDPDGSPMSIALGTDVRAAGSNAASILAATPKGFAVATMKASSARAQAQELQRDPLPPSDPHHGLVVGDKPKSVQRALRDVSTWELPPIPDQLTDQQISELGDVGLYYAPTLGRFVAYQKVDPIRLPF